MNERPDTENTSADESTTPTTGGRTWLVALVVVLFVVYPAVRWLTTRNSAPAGAPPAASTPAAPAAALMAESFRAYQAQKYEESIAAAQKALAADPTLADAYNNIAASFMGLKKTDEALAAVQQALKLNPNLQLAKNNLAWIQQERAKANRPSLPPETVAKVGQLLNQSLAQTQAKQYRECIATAGEATKLDPFAARAFNNLGFCHALLGQWDDAIKSAQQAIALDGTLQIAKNNLAWMQQEKAKASK